MKNSQYISRPIAKGGSGSIEPPKFTRTARYSIMWLPRPQESKVTQIHSQQRAWKWGYSTRTCTC